VADRCRVCAEALLPRAAFCGACGEFVEDAPPHPAEALTAPAASPEPERTGTIAVATPPSTGTPALPRNLDAYRTRLQERFGYPEFRGGQAHVLEALASDDVLAVMPTGSGKSLCYVLPALEVGRTVVVSPLIALMQDQVEGLRAAGVAATFINSNLDRAEQNQRYRAFVAGEIDLLFVAPERFANAAFTRGLAAAGVHLLAIDEAHCISEWGHNFRPDYLQLGVVRERLGTPRTLALTATANPQVRRDIVRRLGIEGRAVEVVTTINRPNLSFSVELIPDEDERTDWLREFVRERAGSAGIVYARTRRKVEELATALDGPGVRAAAYHAGMDRGTRTQVQRAFTVGEVPVIVATNAFGMGIDKPDVRYVVHFNLPGRLEAYYQEAGRAGRDGDPAECALLYGPRDESAQQYFIRNAHPTEAQVRRMWARWLGLAGSDDLIPMDELDDEGAPMAIAALRASGLIEDVELRLRTRYPHARIDMSVITAHRNHAYDRLREMVEYAETDGCRRAVILRYFGDEAPDRCSACDNCLRPPAPRRERRPEPDRATRRRGAATATETETDANLLAALREWRRQRAQHEGIPAFRIAYDRHLASIAAAMPDTAEALAELTNAAVARHGDEVIAIVDRFRPGAPIARAQDAVRHDPLYEALRAWRLERARMEGVPAYTIFSDRTLRELVAVRPRNVQALLRIWGLGEARVDRFGAELVRTIGEHDGEE
jgi:ATP-dependent DNA helicase RecQ